MLVQKLQGQVRAFRRGSGHPLEDVKLRPRARAGLPRHRCPTRSTPRPCSTPRHWAERAIGWARRGRPAQSGRVVPSLRLQFRPGVPEGERPVEHERTGRRVGIGAEVAEPLELHGLAGRQAGERRLYETAPEHGLAVRVQVLEEVATAGPGVRAPEEVVICLLYT